MTASDSLSPAPQDRPADEPATPPGSGRPGISSGGPAFAPIPRSYYPVATALFVAVMLISTIAATKGVLFFSGMSFSAGPLSVDGLVLDGAFFLFPLAYILGDLISEVWGFRAMRRVTFLGFGALLLSALYFQLAIALPAPDFYEGQDSFEAVVGQVPRLFIAGVAAYIVGQLLNSYVLVSMKRRVGEKRLWARLVGSTVVGEAADTIIFCVIAAPVIGIATSDDLINYTVVGFVWKTGVEVVVMPLTYAVVHWVKRHEPGYRLGPRSTA